MDKNQLKEEIAKKAAATGRKTLTASQRSDLVTAIKLARGMELVAETTVNQLPGFSPMQLRSHLDHLSEIAHEIKIMEERLGDELKKLKNLEKEEKAGLELLKKAGEQMTEKGQYIAETDKAILKFTAYAQGKSPGLEQMLASSAKAKPGEKAGDLFLRVANQYGEELAKGVMGIIETCKADLTHAANCVRGLQVVSKTASLDPRIVKNAGLAETVVSIKEWLSGKTDSLVTRIMGFAGGIEKWFKGFVERTKLVKKSKDSVENAISNLQKAAEKLLASA